MARFGDGVGSTRGGTGGATSTGGAGPGAGATGGAVAGRLDRMRAWPGTRAVVGGLLVAGAVLGVLVLTSGDSDRDGRDVLVAARDLAAGAVLEPGDLAVAAVSLPDELAAATFSDPVDLVGRRLLSPLGQAELFGPSALDDPAGSEGRGFEVAVRLDADRAVDGRLRTGETVAVVATFGTGEAAPTRTVADDVVVAEVRRGDLDAAGGGSVTVTLTSDDAAVAGAVATAADAGDLRLVRVTPAAGDGPVDGVASP